MIEKNTKTVRIKRETHEILRWLSYKQNKPISEIVDEKFQGQGPTTSEKIDLKLRGK